MPLFTPTTFGAAFSATLSRLFARICTFKLAFALMRPPALLGLCECGVDLQRCGADEKALHLSGAVNKNFMIGPSWDVDVKFTDLLCFSYGPLTEDWQFWFSEPTDASAAEFWAMVESFTGPDDSELPIPWVADR